MITQAQYTEGGTILATIDGTEYFIPDDMANRHRQMIAEWEADGNTIAPYEPPVLTEDQMRESELQQDLQFLADTDYITAKLSEAMALGQDISELLDKYSSVLAERENARIRIRLNSI